MSIEARQITAEEFEQYIDQPENQDRHLELFHGEIVEDMPTEEHGLIVGNLYAILREYVRSNSLGRVVLDVRRKSTGDEFNTLIPDVDFTSNERLQARNMSVVSEGPVHQMPDLAVDVQSPGQSAKFMTEKAAYYLDHNVRMVWLVYPSKRIVEVLTNDWRELLSIEDVLQANAVIPGFSVRVEEIFSF